MTKKEEMLDELEKYIEYVKVNYSRIIFNEDYIKEISKNRTDITNRSEFGIEYDLSKNPCQTEAIYLPFFKSSTFVYIYAFFEASMEDLCHYLYEKNNYPKRLSEIKGIGIERSKNYLKKYSGVHFNLFNKEWQTLKEFNKVRNCIIHAGGNVNKSREKDKLEEVFKKPLAKSVIQPDTFIPPNIKMEDDGTIYMSINYINNLLSVVYSFLTSLYDYVLTDE